MPYGTNSRFDASQAINCLATIVVSRDQSASIRSLSRHSEAAADSSAVGLLLRVSFSSPIFYNFHKIPCQNRSVRLITVTGHVLPL